MTPYPKPSAAAARWLVHQLSDASLHVILRDIGDARQDICKGFQFSPQIAANPVVRSRFQASITQHPQLIQALLDGSGMPWSPWLTFLPALRPDWLRRQWRALARRAGGRHFLVALCGHEDAGLSRRAWRCLRNHTIWSAPADTTPDPGEPLRTFAPRRPVAAWEALLDVAGTLRHPPGTTDPERVKRLASEVARLQQELAALRAQSSKARNARESTAQAATEQCQTLEDERRRLQRELRAAQEKLQEQERNSDERAERLADARMQSFRQQVLGLTPELLAATAQGAVGHAGPLTARADALLERLRGLNEAHARAETVRAEIRDIEALRHRLLEARAESVIQLPDLDQLEQEIAGQLAALYANPALGSRDDEPPLVRELRERIAAAPATAAGRTFLAQTETALATLPLASLIEPFWQVRLRAALAQRREHVVRLEQERILAAAAPPAAKASAAAQAPQEIWHVTPALLSAAPGSHVCVLVDAYNVIKLVPALSAIEQARGVAAARERLLELCRQRGKPFAALSLELIFDGQGALSTREHDGAVTVVFTAARESEQNADHYIEAACARRHAAGQKTWVVTADGGLRFRAARHVSAYIGPADFYRFLEHG